MPLRFEFDGIKYKLDSVSSSYHRYDRKAQKN